MRLLGLKESTLSRRSRLFGQPLGRVVTKGLLVCRGEQEDMPETMEEVSECPHGGEGVKVPAGRGRGQSAHREGRGQSATGRWMGQTPILHYDHVMCGGG